MISPRSARRRRYRPLTVAYLGGPIDAAHVRRCWAEGVPDDTYHGTRYLAQFYEVCAAHGLRTHVVAPTEELRRSDHRDIEYWRVPFRNRGGALYHLGQILHLGRFALRAARLRVDVAVVVPSPPYWFVLFALRAAGVAVVPSVHRVLWTRFRPLKRGQALFLRLTRPFFVHGCGPVLVVSEEIAAQVRELTRDRKPDQDLLVFRPTYRREPLVGTSADERTTSGDRGAGGGGGPFRVLFAGRVERDKGVFLLLDVVEQLAAAGHDDVELDVCGTGSALAPLREAVARAGLEDRIRCHGHCGRAELQARYAACDVVVVPTTTAFVEGFNKVVAEAVLAGRPVITSEVCPALSTVQEAAVAVPPDQAGPYAEAILRLRDDEELYASKQAACLRLREQFLDPERSWGARFDEALRRVLPEAVG